MSIINQDPVWKALSDPTRRSILELLSRDSKTTTEVVENFPNLTRFNVMKHLEVLRSADLVITRQDGRRRINSLGIEPLNLIYEDWLCRLANFGSRKPTGVKCAEHEKPQRISTTKKRNDFGWKRYD